MEAMLNDQTARCCVLKDLDNHSEALDANFHTVRDKSVGQSDVAAI